MEPRGAVEQRGVAKTSACFKQRRGAAVALLAPLAATWLGGPAAATTLGAQAMGLSLELRPPGALVRVIVWAAGVKDWSLEAGRSNVGSARNQRSSSTDALG